VVIRGMEGRDVYELVDASCEGGGGRRMLRGVRGVLGGARSLDGMFESENM
jgi:hypothetical protein